MGLPSLFSNTQPAEKLYLTIVLTESYVQSSYWQFNEQQILIKDRSDRHPYIDDQDCIKQIDASLQELGKESESANEVVFGLEPSWVTQTGVSDQRKPLLKKITQDLSLKAVGFVVIGEAVFQHLLKQQPFLTSLLLEIQKEELRVSLVKQGKLLASEKVGRSGDTAADLAEGLARFGKAAPALAQLPSKIIMFSYQLTEDELANEEQTILHHDWMTQQTFVQPPLIEILAAQAVLDAVVLEGGAAVGQSMGIAAVTATAEAQPEEPAAMVSSFGVPIAAGAMSGEAADEAMASNVVPAELAVPTPETALPSSLPNMPSDEPPPDDDDLPTKPARFAWLSKLTPYHLKHHPMILAGLLGGLLVVVIGIYAFLRFTATATLAVQLRTEPVSREVSLILDPAATAPSETTLPVNRVTREIEGSLTLPTTGVKLVGDQAKGKVTLFNKTTSPKTFDAGTVLRSGQLEFTLDQEVTVASASVTTSGSSETKTFGQSDVNITAREIGTESNVAKDTQFRVESFDESTYAATSTDALTGGSSREVRVASEADRAKLLEELRADLLETAEQEFKSDTSNGTRLVPSGRITIQQSTYSAQVGAEVDTLTLNATAVVEAYSYENEQLRPLAEQLLQNEIPSGYVLVTDSIQILSDAQLETASASSLVRLEANLSSLAKPDLDAESFKSEVAGVSLSQLPSLLGSKNEVANYTVAFQPSLAQAIIRRLPTGDRLMIVLE